MPGQTSREEEPAYEVPPVRRAVSVLRHIAAGNRCKNISSTAKSLNISRTTLIRILATLESEGMIEQVADGDGYQLGTGLIVLASQALNNRSILQVARPFLAQLVRELNLSAHFGVLDGREIVYLVRESPNSHLASMVREGTRLPAHATTIGRALLAELPTDALRALYADQPMEAYTPKTSTTLPELEEQLRMDRARGIVWSVANFEPGIGSAAVTVYDHQARPVGAINVTGHASLFAEDSPLVPDIERCLKNAARGMSEALGYRGWPSEQM